MRIGRHFSIDELVRYAEGGPSPEVAAHIGECALCATNVAQLKRILTIAAIPVYDAPQGLIVEAQQMMAPMGRTIVARLSPSYQLAPARAGSDEFQLLVEFGDDSLRLMYSRVGAGWEVMGRAPAESFYMSRRGALSACVPGGRFSFAASDLASTGFELHRGGDRIEIPSAEELLANRA